MKTHQTNAEKADRQATDLCSSNGLLWVVVDPKFRTTLHFHEENGRVVVSGEKHKKHKCNK